MMRTLILVCSALLLGGCNQRFNQESSFHCQSERAKSIVAVLPVLDRTGHEDYKPSWDLSQEFTSEIINRLQLSGKTYVVKHSDSAGLAEVLSNNDLLSIPTTLNMSAIRPAEFLLIAEVIEQKELTGKVLETALDNAFLVTARVRVFDVRNGSPKIVLQEVLQKEVRATKANNIRENVKLAWGVEGFQHTYIGMAHSRLLKELVARVEGYIDSVR